MNDDRSEPRARLGSALVAVDHYWTRSERWVCTVVIVLEILTLSAWVALRGLSTAGEGTRAGLVFRALAGAVVLGTVAYFALKKLRVRLAPAAAVCGVLAGVLLAKSWASFGVGWASNLLNWLQQASTLTLLGGLRGVGTRLTLILALIGGSLATGAGHHITIDLVTRFVPQRRRALVSVIGWLGAAAICFSAAWGFFDHISIEDFGANADAGFVEKSARVAHGLDEAWFVLRKQLALDLKSLPHVVRGESYADWLGGIEWSAWLDSSGFAERFGIENVAALRIPEDARRAPIVLVPGEGEPRGMLAHAANLVFPLGLSAIAMRFALLSLLVLSGRRNLAPEAAGDALLHGADRGGDR